METRTHSLFPQGIVTMVTVIGRMSNKLTCCSPALAQLQVVIPTWLCTFHPDMLEIIMDVYLLDDYFQYNFLELSMTMYIL